MTDPDSPSATALRAALARRLSEQGHIRSAAWRRAVEAVPRHVFVPHFYQQVGRDWEKTAEGDPGHLATVYEDRALTTQVTEAVPTSSSSQPSLMLRMLEALDVAAGHRVIEIGTGTGYNAALLSERLGSDHVTTVEVDRLLAELAEARLRACGYGPTVVAADGRGGPCGRGAVRPPHRDLWVQRAAALVGRAGASGGDHRLPARVGERPPRGPW
ncbi:rRNA adenine N-6-methyltransferase family protein [Streptomyces sp. URMC 129]|uniref:rRNA adenine N-6-methyltransferase family protein n=1 Tax=Streptomyces sp. URMC 129 TaxID=3423407 RepID=UPI003F1CC396